MNKSESKYFNTATKMDKALIALLAKKDFAYITVKEICVAAGVNRSTFYLHYENTTDLLHEATRYILDGFLNYFSATDREEIENISTRNTRDLVFVTPKYLIPYLTYIKENRGVFQTALKHLKTMEFEKVYQKLYTFIFDPILERFRFPAEERGYVMRFYLTGVTAIVNEWLVNGCCEPIEKIADIIAKCTVGNYLQNEEK